MKIENNWSWGTAWSNIATLAVVIWAFALFMLMIFGALMALEQSFCNI